MLKSRKVSLMFVTGAMALFTGCSSINDVIKADTNEYYGVPDNYSSLQQKGYSLTQREKAEYFASAKTKQLQAAEKNGLRPVFGDHANFEMVLTNNSVIIDSTWSSPKGVFSLGEYNVLRAKTADRGAVAFLELVASGITDMLSDLEQAGLDYKMIIEYSGSTDGHQINPNSLVYKGEYGPVVMSDSITSLNGSSVAFQINPGQYISSNAELGALRAFSLKQWTNAAIGASANHINIEEKFSITTHEQKGRAFRSIHLRLEILTDEDG